jgi:Bacterial Ig-like domain (group 2)
LVRDSSEVKVMRACRWSAAYLLVVAMSAGCSNSTTPPSPVPSTPNALIIGGVRALEEGATVTLTVSVSVPGGALKDVPEDAAVTWSSSNKSIATVSDRGVVTALRTGKVDIGASFDQLSAIASVTVTPGPPIFSGYVYEIPTRIGIQGSSIAVVDASGQTRTIQTQFGQFTVRLPTGRTRFTVTASGYESTELSIDVSNTTGTLQLGMLPLGSDVRERAGVPWEEWHGGPIPGAPVRQASLSIVVNQPGTIRTYVDACLSGCLASEMALLCAEIRDSSNRVVLLSRGQYDNGPGIPNFQTKGGERYEIKIGVCSEFDPAYSMKRYYIDVTHPK